VTVSNGTEFTADVIIGADGVRSNVRPFVVDGDTTAQPTGESGYRYLLRPEDLKAINHPLMKEDTIPPTINVVIGPQKKLVLYPCRGGQVFNCLAFVRECIIPTWHLFAYPAHPADTELHETSSEKWQRKGDVNALLESYKDFDPMWTDILK
jgi:salicylate hydroxylase